MLLKGYFQRRGGYFQRRRLFSEERSASLFPD
jgi:hypothetical protein